MTDRLFCYYGDDFTGSTDALEALAANGVPSVLFLDPPSDEALARFPECRAIGIAGESRSRGPEWMTEHLPGVFQRLKEYGAPMCQYKVCSTFDSGPRIGSIGRALEIGKQVFQTAFVPVVVAAPHLGRYVLFGNLFAAGGGAIHRIDRHPTMGHHPVTPMDEADLRLHLARQTDCKIGLLDLLALRSGQAETKLAEVVVFDGLDDQTLEETGRLLWMRSAFAVGSAGLTHSLIRYWRASGMIPAHFTPPAADEVDRLVVISGSRSPVTEKQIRWAIAHGFTGLCFNDASLDAALRALAGGRSVVIYSALGPADCSGGLQGEDLGRSLGILLREVLSRSGVRRAVVAGGDTSTHAVRQLGIDAMTFAAVTVPGAPLCRAGNLELVLKGGQVGPENFFELVRRGKP
jgi:3-oxoisoapionate kinase